MRETLPQLTLKHVRALAFNYYQLRHQTTGQQC